jgi:hypothetical protein
MSAFWASENRGDFIGFRPPSQTGSRVGGKRKSPKTLSRSDA